MARASKSKRERSREAVHEAVAQAGGLEAAAPGRAARPQDPITGELRRRDVLPLLVLHLIAEAPSYGNQLMERIAGHDGGRAVGQPEHDVPAAARARAARADRGQLGAPRAAHAPLLLAHRRRAARSTSGSWRRCGRSSTRSARASTRSCARCTASEARGGRAGRWCSSPSGSARALDRPGPLAHFRGGLRPCARGGPVLAGAGLEGRLGLDPRRPRPGDRAGPGARRRPVGDAGVRGRPGGHPDLRGPPAPGTADRSWS